MEQRPRHAELFATDLDDEALIRTIDRVLMFYVRTADKLQRTSVWRESLEGGLDYLKAVILDDSLNLAAELESQMQHVVDSYQCEWANAISDPEKLKAGLEQLSSNRRPKDSKGSRSSCMAEACSGSYFFGFRGTVVTECFQSDVVF